MITQEELKYRFQYQDGNLIYKYAVGKRPIGAIAGYKKPDGYWRIYIKGKGYYLHRVIWFYFHGVWPKELDHIDRNKSNNKLENLRSVTHKENQQWMIGKSLYDRKCRF